MQFDGTEMEAAWVGIWLPSVSLALRRTSWSSHGERCQVSWRTGLAECSKFRRDLDAPSVASAGCLSSECVGVFPL